MWHILTSRLISCPLLADRLHLCTSGKIILTYLLEKTCWEGARGWASQRQGESHGSLISERYAR